MGDIMIHVGDIMSTVGVFSTVGYSNDKRFPPWYLTPSMVLMISPTCIMIFPMVLNISHGTQDDPPTVLMISPMVLHTPHSTQDIPHIYHDIPHGTEHPHSTQDISHCTHDIPHGTEHPHSTEHPPQYCTHIIQGDYTHGGIYPAFLSRNIFVKFGTFVSTVKLRVLEESSI